MTTEEKDLLRKDLSARFPYSVIVSVTDGTIKYNAYIESISYNNIQVSPVNDSNFTAYTFYKISDIKPYLRPMSSMTDEEKKEIEKITNDGFYVHSNHIANFKSQTYKNWDGNWHSSYNYYNYPVTNVECNKLISWLDKKHFDHRTDEEGKTLIEKGLAIEAPKDMYK